MVELLLLLLLFLLLLSFLFLLSSFGYFSEALVVAGLQLIPMGVAGTIRPVDSPLLPTPKFFSPDIESR